MFRKALGYYGKNIVYTAMPYFEEPWVDLPEEKFGDREAAKHFLRAYDISVHITLEVCAIAWHPFNGDMGRHFCLKYYYFADKVPSHGGDHTSPARGGGSLLQSTAMCTETTVEATTHTTQPYTQQPLL